MSMVKLNLKFNRKSYHCIYPRKCVQLLLIYNGNTHNERQSTHVSNLAFLNDSISQTDEDSWPENVTNKG